ncbi:MAG: glutamate--tRNA ligase, partial [Vulcanimicrobiaceae bacterium]
FAGRLPVTATSFAGAKVEGDELRRALALAMWRLDGERSFDKATIETVLKGVSDLLGRKFRDLARVYYVAMTGSPTSLPLFDSMELLGRDLCRERFRVALDALGGVSAKEQKEWQKNAAPVPEPEPVG